MKTKKGTMNYQILTYPKHHADLFESNHTLKVHSAFQSTLNLLSKDSLVTLQHRDSLKTPMSIVLDISPIDFHLMINQGVNDVHITKEGILIKNKLFSLMNAREIDYDLSKMSTLNKTEISCLNATLEEFLCNSNRSGELAMVFRMNHGNPSSELSFFGQYAKSILDKLSRVDHHEYIDTCLTLLGMGEGLTPSGDDFICGLLAATYFSEEKNVYDLRIELIATLLDKLNSTTDISKAYLLHACNGRFMEGVLQLQQQTQQKNDITPILNQIASMGHSSGTDFLVGMVFGLKLGGTI